MKFSIQKSLTCYFKKKNVARWMLCNSYLMSVFYRHFFFISLHYCIHFHTLPLLNKEKQRSKPSDYDFFSSPATGEVFSICQRYSTSNFSMEDSIAKPVLTNSPQQLKFLLCNTRHISFIAMGLTSTAQVWRTAVWDVGHEWHFVCRGWLTKCSPILSWFISFQ